MTEKRLSSLDKNAVQLCDVTLRDGLQMESASISTEDKYSLFEKLSRCGYQRLEITSFVSPKWVPQLADGAELSAKIFAKKPEIECMAFVPNEKGLDRLLEHPIPWVSAFVAASRTFNQKNVNAGTDETLGELAKIAKRVRKEKRKLRLYISTMWGCPYEGAMKLAARMAVVKKVAALDPDEIALGDTLGVAVPEAVIEVVTAVRKVYPLGQTVLHFHDTYGLGLACVQAGYRIGVRRFDGSTGGIGGCPYAKGATGNLATELIAYLAHRQSAFPQFRVAAIEETLKFMSEDLKLEVKSRLFEILRRGAKLYGVAS